VAEGCEACLYCDYPDQITEQWEKDTTSIRPGEPTDLCDCVASSGIQPVSLCFNSVSRDDIGDYTCVQRVGFGRALRCTVTLSLAGEESISVVCVWVCVWKGRHRYGLCGGRLEGGGVVCCS